MIGIFVSHNKEFLFGPRGFKNQYEMNEAIIKNHNAIVQSDDDVFCLGDCVLSDTETGIKCIKQLKGNIHLICGNHDSAARRELYNNCYNIVEICDAKFLDYKKYHFFLSHFPCLCGNHDMDKPLKTRLINLCGHSHYQNKFKDMDKGIIYHCELDAHNNTPILIDDIIEDIKFFISLDKNDQLNIIKKDIL